MLLFDGTCEAVRPTGPVSIITAKMEIDFLRSIVLNSEDEVTGRTNARLLVGLCQLEAAYKRR